MSVLAATTANSRGSLPRFLPVSRETYANGVRKTTYVDPDGNEIGFGGLPG